MGNSSVISQRNEWFFDPFQGAGGGQSGVAGGAGGAIAGLAAAGAAIVSQIVNQKTQQLKDQQLANLGKPKVDYPGIPSEKEEKPLIPDGITSELTQPGIQELPYLPNAGAIGAGTHLPTPGKSIPSDLTQPGVQELPYLPNAGTISQGKEDILIQNPQAPGEIEPTPPLDIKDETQTNVEQGITAFDMQNMYDFIIQQQERQWAREDAIREQTRFDQQHAYEYAVESAKRAGINPNLVNISPAQSGGGITNATGLDYSPWTAEIDKQLALMEQEIQNSFQGDENAKDRFTKGLTSLLQLFTMFALKG